MEIFKISMVTFLLTEYKRKIASKDVIFQKINLKIVTASKWKQETGNLMSVTISL